MQGLPRLLSFAGMRIEWLTPAPYSSRWGMHLGKSTRLGTESAGCSNWQSMVLHGQQGTNSMKSTSMHSSGHVAGHGAIQPYTASLPWNALDMLRVWHYTCTITPHVYLQYLQSQQVALGRPSLIFSTGSPLPRKCVDGNTIDVASGELQGRGGPAWWF
jgi:hypothetical protein